MFSVTTLHEIRVRLRREVDKRKALAAGAAGQQGESSGVRPTDTGVGRSATWEDAVDAAALGGRVAGYTTGKQSGWGGWEEERGETRKDKFIYNHIVFIGLASASHRFICVLLMHYLSLTTCFVRVCVCVVFKS